MNTNSQTRDFTVELIRSDSKSREVELSFSSEAPVERFDCFEILDHGKESVDLQRLNNSGALLVNHDPDKQVGCVSRAWIGGDRKGRAVVRFGHTDFSKQIFEDVASGIRRLVSVGYTVLDSVRERAAEVGGKPALRVTKWLPLELSLVAIPADASVGVGRGLTFKTGKKDSKMTTTENEVASDASERVQNILAFGKQFKVVERAAQAVIDGTSYEAFRQAIFTERMKSQTASPSPAMPEGSDYTRESEHFSITRAISGILEHGRLSGREKEFNDEIARRAGTKPRGIWVPVGCLVRRDLSTATSASGGGLVPTAVAPTVEALKPASRVIEAGATVLTGFTGPFQVPRIANGGSTATWVSETQSVPETPITFNQLTMSPNALACYIAYSRELLLQSSDDIEALIRNDFTRAIGVGIDKAALQGLGASGEPLGLFNLDTSTSGINTVTFGAAATLAKALEFTKNIEVDNVDSTGLRWLISPATKEKWAAKSVG